MCLGGMLPVCLIALVVTTLEMYKTWYYLTNVLIASVLGAFNITLSALGGQPDHGPQMLYAFSVFLFQGLRFPYSWPLCWLLYFIYFFVNIPTDDYNDVVCSLW